MKYKTIFCDFDGTLLKNDNSLSERSIKAVREFVRRGGTFIINTGRMDMSVRNYLSTLGIDKQKISVVSLQGSIIKNNNEKVLSKIAIDCKTSVKILRIFEERGIYVHTYDDDCVLVKELDKISVEYEQLCGAKLKVVGTISDYVEKTGKDCIKILAVIPEEKTEDYMREFDELAIEGTKHFMASETFFECVPSVSGKEAGMINVCKMLGVDVKDVMAFGDNGNDLEMIRQAGFGVAVANAREEVRAVADYVCPSNEDDGVAQTIEKLCLEED